MRKDRLRGENGSDVNSIELFVIFDLILNAEVVLRLLETSEFVPFGISVLRIRLD